MVSIGISSLSFNEIQSSDNRKIAFQYLTNEKVLLDIYEYYDNQGLLEGYTSHVTTPVCEDKACLEAEVDIYWNLPGNFIKFSLVPENPLTKLDHIPFDNSDYQKLNEILLDKTPSFIHLKRSELTSGNVYESNEVDGISSATIAEVKEDMVEGAIFTCYTLWYIANGGISFNIQEHTSKKIDHQLIAKMVRSENTESHYFLIENIKPAFFEGFLNEVVTLAMEYDAFFIQRIIEKGPENLNQNPLNQDFLLGYFNDLEYSSKNELLKKLKNGRLKKNNLEFLVKHLHPANTKLNQLIIKLICNNAADENIDVLIEMFQTLIDHRIEVSSGSYRRLINLEQQHDELIKIVRKLKKTIKS